MGFPSNFGLIPPLLQLGYSTEFQQGSIKYLDWKSPHDIPLDAPPNFEMAKPFGCLAYAANLTPHKGKFTFKSLKCIFLEYDSSHKGYLLYNLDNSKVLNSGDVHFVPHTFPFLQPDQIIPDPPTSLLGVLDTDTPFVDTDSLLYVTDLTSSPHVSSFESPPLNFTSPPRVDPTPVHDDQVLRRSTIDRIPHVWMKDFVGNVDTTLLVSLSTGIAPHTFPYVINKAFTRPYVDYLFNITMHSEPKSFKEASQHP